MTIPEDLTKQQADVFNGQEDSVSAPPDSQRPVFQPATFTPSAGQSVPTSARPPKSPGVFKKILTQVLSRLRNGDAIDTTHDAGPRPGSFSFIPPVSYDGFEKAFVSALGDGTVRTMPEQIRLLNETLFTQLILPAVQQSVIQSGNVLSDTFLQNQEQGRAIQPGANGSDLSGPVVPDIETAKIFYGDVLTQVLSEVVHPAFEAAAEYGGQALSRGRILLKEDRQNVTATPLPAYASAIPSSEKTTADPMSHKLPSPEDLSTQAIDPDLGEIRPFQPQKFTPTPPPPSGMGVGTGTGTLPPHLSSFTGKTAG